jgi:hypothetical protein
MERRWNNSQNDLLAELEISVWDLKMAANRGSTEIHLSHPKSSIRWRRHLKGLSHERGWTKSAENLGAYSFNSNPSIDTTFSQVNLGE